MGGVEWSEGACRGMLRLAFMSEGSVLEHLQCKSRAHNGVGEISVQYSISNTQMLMFAKFAERVGHARGSFRHLKSTGKDDKTRVAFGSPDSRDSQQSPRRGSGRVAAAYICTQLNSKASKRVCWEGQSVTRIGNK